VNSDLSIYLFRWIDLYLSQHRNDPTTPQVSETRFRCPSLSLCVCACVFVVCVCLSLPPRAPGMGGGSRGACFSGQSCVRGQGTPSVGGYLGPAPCTVRHTAGALTFTRYCNDQYCMVYGLVKGGSGRSRLLRNSRAIALQ